MQLKLKQVKDLLIELNHNGSYVGDYDASTNTLPLSGSGLYYEINQGDFWRVTSNGYISGLEPDSFLNLNDLLYAKIDNATLVEDFFVHHIESSSSNIKVATYTELITDVLYHNLDVNTVYQTTHDWFGNGDETLVFTANSDNTLYGTFGVQIVMTVSGTINMIYDDELGDTVIDEIIL